MSPINPQPVIVFAAMTVVTAVLGRLLDLLWSATDAFAFLALCIGGTGAVIALVFAFERRNHSQQSRQPVQGDLLPPPL